MALWFPLRCCCCSCWERPPTSHSIWFPLKGLPFRFLPRTKASLASLVPRLPDPRFDNPDAKIREFYGSVARAIWACSIYLNGEWVFCASLRRPKRSALEVGVAFSLGDKHPGEKARRREAEKAAILGLWGPFLGTICPLEPQVRWGRNAFGFNKRLGF